MENVTVADRIRLRLEALGKNASAVALEAGLSRSSVLDILKGKAANPRLDTLQKLTGPLECSLDYLTGSAPPESTSHHTRTWEEYSNLHPDRGGPLLKAEGLIYRPLRDKITLGPEYPQKRLAGWQAHRLILADHSMEEIGLFEHDIVEVLSPKTPQEFVLKRGMLVLARHVLEGPRLEQLSIRMVMSTSVDKLALAIRPTQETGAAIMADYVSSDPDQQLPLNHYPTAGGGTIEIMGIVSSLLREYPVTEFSRKSS